MKINSIIFGMFILLIVVSIAASYFQHVVNKDKIVYFTAVEDVSDSLSTLEKFFKL